MHAYGCHLSGQGQGGYHGVLVIKVWIALAVVPLSVSLYRIWIAAAVAVVASIPLSLSLSPSLFLPRALAALSRGQGRPARSPAAA